MIYPVHYKCNRPALGQLVDGEWKWSPVVWTKCWCGMFHSNRLVPKMFWNRVWEKDSAPKRSAGILLVKNFRKDTKYFLVQSYNNLFGIPKGSMNKDESYFETANREFYEETGTKLNLKQSECMEIRRYIGKTEMSVFVVEVPWNFEITTFPITDVEINSFGFVSKKNIKKMKVNMVTKNVFEIINKA